MLRSVRSEIARRIYSITGGLGRAAYGLWLVLVLTQPVSLHTCPVEHHGIAQSAQTLLAQTDGELCLLPGQAAAEATHSSHSHDDTAQCECVGQCCVAPAVIMPAASSYVPVPERIALEEPRQQSDTPVRSAPKYLQPPATAPPVLVMTA